MSGNAIPVRIRAVQVRPFTYRYLGFVEVEAEDGRSYRLPMTGSVAQWLQPGEACLLTLKHVQGDPGFEGYALERGGVPVWPPFQREYTLERTSPLTDRPLYRYRVRAREAVFERDYEAILELEQYHYASDEDLLARWFCEGCRRVQDANARPTCPACRRPMRFQDLRSATRASRFLVLERLEGVPYEPVYLGYVRADPPLPLMHRRLPDGSVQRNIREAVFPPEWFRHPFQPREDVPPSEWWEEQGRVLATARSPVTRLARIVVHPDYRVDGLGQAGVDALADWCRERRVPEMREEKEALETVAMMARYNPFLERAGFVYLWDTAGGRPVLYRALGEAARQAIARFLEEDPVARQHRGRLFRSRFPAVDPLAGPIRLRGIVKGYTSRLSLEDLSEPVQEVLAAFGVRYRVIQRVVLPSVDAELAPGSVVAVVGASGAGKTTFLRLLVGLARQAQGDPVPPTYLPDAGEWEVPPNVRVAAYLPGELEPPLQPETPVAEALYRLTGDAGLAVELLNYAGISDAVLYRAPFGELSTGQKERARLAFLLATRANLVVVDEFCAHLDLTTAMRVARRVGRLAREKGFTLVVATHRWEILSALEPEELYLVGYGTFLRQTSPLPERALQVLEPYATYIVEGKKRWELRRYPTRVRGRVGIVSRGQVIGSVEVVGSQGPFSVEELREHAEKHLADPAFLERYARGGPLYVWVLAHPEKYEPPVPLEKGQRGGPQVWLRLGKGRRRHLGGKEEEPSPS